jgi:hypothetical protein
MVTILYFLLLLQQVAAVVRQVELVVEMQIVVVRVAAA